MIRYCILFLVALCLFATVQAQGVGIGTATPHPSAKLDVTATNRGFLPPRMTTAQRNAIASPAAGLVIYNTTTNCLEFWNTGAWINICTPVCAFTQSLSASSGSVVAGNSVNVNATLGITTPTVGNMTTAVTGLPTGVTVASITNNPAAAAGTQLITFNTTAATVPGVYVISLATTAANGCNGPLTNTYTLTVTAPPACVFTQSLGTSSGTVSLGGSLNITVSLGITTPTPGNMTTSVTGLPANVTVGGITNNPRTTAGNQVITLNIGAGAIPGVYSIIITTTAANGCNGPLSLTYTLTITNIPCPPVPCDLVNGNLILFSCYESPNNTWTINVNQNIANLKVGIVFYDDNPAGALTINFAGAFAGNVTGVIVINYDGNINVTGVPAGIVTEHCLGGGCAAGAYPPGPCQDTRVGPFGQNYGNNNILCGSICEAAGPSYGGCNTQGEIEAFMLAFFPGSTLRWHEMKYSYTSNTFNVNAARTTCCQSVYP